jgi:hypothetical protein
MFGLRNHKQDRALPGPDDWMCGRLAGRGNTGRGYDYTGPIPHASRECHTSVIHRELCGDPTTGRAGPGPRLPVGLGNRARGARGRGGRLAKGVKAKNQMKRRALTWLVLLA